MAPWVSHSLKVGGGPGLELMLQSAQEQTTAQGPLLSGVWVSWAMQQIWSIGFIVRRFISTNSNNPHKYGCALLCTDLISIVLLQKGKKGSLTKNDLLKNKYLARVSQGKFSSFIFLSLLKVKTFRFRKQRQSQTGSSYFLHGSVCKG